MTTLTKTKKTILLGVAALATLGVLTPFVSAADSAQTDQTSNIEFNISQVKEKLASQIGSGKVTEVSLKAKKSKDQNTLTKMTDKKEIDKKIMDKKEIDKKIMDKKIMDKKLR